MAADPSVTLAADTMLPRRFFVHRTTWETSDVATLLLDPLDEDGLTFEPGQFTMIGRPGFGEIPLSICGDPAHPEVLAHTVRAVGTASTAVARARRGDVLLARGPFGHGWNVRDGAGGDVIIVAGGIGLAPLRPALLDVLANRELFQRVFLVYGARTPEQFLYTRELERWRGRFDLDVAVTVDAATSDWRGQVGVVTTVLPTGRFDPDNTLALVCGPEIMMRLAADGLCDLGVPEPRVRVSLERNMKCGVGLCGHCQIREHFVCQDGPVFDYDRIRRLITAREV
jgi:NAD(P)H-flavin reductase